MAGQEALNLQELARGFEGLRACVNLWVLLGLVEGCVYFRGLGSARPEALERSPRGSNEGF